MSTQIYTISMINNRIFSFLLQDGKALEIHCDELEAESILNNIYIGKIKNIAKNINAAFVEIASGSVCYLPIEDMKNPIYTKKGTSRLPQAGDELLVQVCREGIKTKFPSVTTNITLYGKYALLTTGNHSISVSSKLSQREKERLYGMVMRIEADSEHVNFGSSDESCCENSGMGKEDSFRRYGWLLRTNAGNAPEEILKKDLLRLQEQYKALMDHAMHRTCFSCLIKTPSPYLNRLSNLYDSEEIRVLTDDKNLYEEIREYLQIFQPEDLSRLEFYQDNLLPMKKLYSLEHQLEQALAEKVWLNSGGYLVIQPTEALTVIDVNTGKFEGGKKKEAAFLKINLEAAKEISRQIRLRNLSGIIIVDFINMETSESNKILMSTLDSCLRQDPIKTVLVDMTKLSLVEITRLKREKTLAESVRLHS